VAPGNLAVVTLQSAIPTTTNGAPVIGTVWVPERSG